jgi:transmembrane sensor
MKHGHDISEHQREAVDWMLRLKPGIATSDDVVAFKAWCKQDPAHAKAFAETRKLWEAMTPAGQKVFDPHLLESMRSRRSTVNRRLFLGGALATSAVVSAVVAIHPPLDLWPSLSELNADYRTAIGEQRKIALANDVAITMNTRTSIGLRPVENAIERIELIAGEGLVSTKSKAFEVVSGNGYVRAADAQFNIRRDGDLVRVACLEGNVTVGCGSSSIMLAKEHQVSYSAAGLSVVAETNLAIVTSWQQGVLVFQDTRLSDVVAEINRYRNGRIVIVGDHLARQSVNGRFYLSRLNEVVEKFQNAFGARVTNLPGGVVVLS